MQDIENKFFYSFIKRPRVLITGGAGFIGNAVVRRLLKNSDCIIYNLDKISYASNLEPINNIIQSMGKEGEIRHTLMKTDLFNTSHTDSSVEHSDPDLVLHLAAETHVDNSIISPKPFIESNIIGTYNLLESVRKHFNKLNSKRKNSFRFLHISTDEVFGTLGEKGSFNELTQYDPRSPYSASKSSSEHLVNAWHHTFGIPVLITNCSNNYGPWQHKEKLIPKVILNAINNSKIPIYGDGKNIRDWLFVEDHVSALVLVATFGRISNTYCVGGHGEITNKDLILKICEIMDELIPAKSPHNRFIKFVKDRPGHDFRYSIDPTKIKRELGWDIKNRLEENLKLTVKWYIDNLDWCKKKLKDKKSY